MDAILALGHFCEVHGPCIILCTQRTNQQTPLQSPHSLTVPWCSACQSIALDQAFISRSAKTECFITTRTPLKQDLAFLLKQAAVRSLSCEYEQNEGGTLYFGDNERGHVISHSFRVQDSLARGFCRKYALLMLMRDKIHLLNSWPFIVPNFKRIALDLQNDAKKVNNSEQEEKPQRSLRQTSEQTNQNRSLSQLTSQPAIHAHLHLWFSWLLGCPVAIEAPPSVASQCSVLPPTMRPYSVLRILRQDMGANLFEQVCYCTIVGIPTFVESTRTLDTFRSCLLPSGVNWVTASALGNVNVTGTCIVYQTETGWTVRCPVTLPTKLPSLQVAVDRALHDEGSLPEQALGLMVSGLVLKWLNTAKTIVRCGHERISAGLLQSLEVRHWDLAMMKYWCMCVQVDVTAGAEESITARKKLGEKLEELLNK